MRVTFTAGGTAVMAAAALVGGLAVIKGQNHRQPLGGLMAGVAQVAGHRMSVGFISPATDTVVTA